MSAAVGPHYDFLTRRLDGASARPPAPPSPYTAEPMVRTKCLAGPGCRR